MGVSEEVNVSRHLFGSRMAFRDRQPAKQSLTRCGCFRSG